METVEKYNNLVNQHPSHMALIETLIHQGELKVYLLRLSREKIDFMSIPNEKNGFACIPSKDIKKLLKTGFRLIDKDKIMLFGLTEFLKHEKEMPFVNQIALKIKNRKLKELAEGFIVEFERHYFIEKMKRNGTKIIQF